MNIAVKKIDNNAGFSESTLLWAIICSILLHVLLVAIIPNIKFDTLKKPEILEIQLAKPEPPPAVIPQPEPPKPEPEPPKTKPEPIEPKLEPKPIVKPSPVVVRKEEPTPVQPNPPPTQPSPPEVITAQPKVEAPQVVAPPKPIVTPAEVSQAHEGYGTTLWNAISKFKKYPRIAQSRGWQGEVIVELSLDGNGKLKSKKIIQNSGYEVLDQQALEMVEKALPFPEPPEALRGSGFTIRVPIPFKLEQP